MTLLRGGIVLPMEGTRTIRDLGSVRGARARSVVIVHWYCTGNYCDTSTNGRR